MKPRPQRAASDHVAVRLDAKTIARLDAARSALSVEWREASRSDVLRAAIAEGLRVLERGAKRREKVATVVAETEVTS